MDKDVGRVGDAEQALVQAPSPAVSAASGFDPSRILSRLPKGAKRALLAMSADWQFAGNATFNANGAHSLHWARNAGGRGALAEAANRQDGKWHRTAYRLTDLGLEMRRLAIAMEARQGGDEGSVEDDSATPQGDRP